MNPFVEIIKKEFWGRTLLSIVIVGSFLAVLIGIEHAMLGDHELDTNWKEILMLLLGALIGGFSKVIDFWFKDHTNDKQLLDKIQEWEVIFLGNHVKEKNTILVKLLSVNTQKTAGNKLLTKAVLEDKNGFLAEAVWFNRKFL